MYYDQLNIMDKHVNRLSLAVYHTYAGFVLTAMSSHSYFSIQPTGFQYCQYTTLGRHIGSNIPP